MTSERKNKICFTLRERSAGKIYIYSEDGLIEVGPSEDADEKL